MQHLNEVVGDPQNISKGDIFYYGLRSRARAVLASLAAAVACDSAKAEPIDAKPIKAGKVPDGAGAENGVADGMARIRRANPNGERRFDRDQLTECA
jgi:hypothetical protein